MNATTPAGSMTLLPAAPGTCPLCATKHPPTYPHNGQSLFYLYRFYFEHGRWPTWADAIAHTSEEMKAFWIEGLHEKNTWSEPPAGIEPIAEPGGVTES